MRQLHCLSLFAFAVALGTVPAAQQASHSAPAATHAAPAPATPTTPKAIGSIKEIMDGIVDPTAEVLFDAVSYESTAAGIQQIKPTTDEDWAKVRRHALLLAEVTNLLRMPGRRVAPANPFLELEKDEVLPDDLAPAQVQILIDADPASFRRFAAKLADAALVALKAADAKDVDGLFDAGDLIDKACENCHLKYWYPKEKPAAAPSMRKR